MKLRILATLFILFLLSGCGFQTEEGLIFKTADPRINVGFRLLQPPAPTVEPAVAPCDIKVNWNGSEFIYHLPGSVSYDRTLVEPAKNEFFACDEQEAIDAGARKALR